MTTALHPTRKDAGARIVDAIETITSGLEMLHATMENPEMVSFHDVFEHFEKLEEALAAHKMPVFLAFADVAERDGAGRVVSSTKAVDYLTKRFDMPYWKAQRLLESARRLFAPPAPVPTPAPEPSGPELVEGTNAEERARAEEEAAKKRAAEEERARRAEAERRAQEELRRKAAEDKLREDTITMIETELRELSRYATPGHNELYNMALEESKSRNYQNLRRWLRNQIRRANLSATDPECTPQRHNVALEKRGLSFTEPDAHGGVRIKGYLDPVAAALLTRALSHSVRPGGPNLAPEDDKRTLDQRRADALTEILQRHLSGKEATAEGTGSIIISATLEDLENLSPETLLPTNTGHLLSPADILRLGAGVSDYLCILDNATLMPLQVVRTKRTANFTQQLALVASELCCTGTECSQGAVNCDVHHVQAWSHGGPTTIENLTLQCRPHHVNNNDHHDGANNMGHMERDPETHSVGRYNPREGRLEFNNSDFAQHSARNKYLRKRARDTAESEDPPAPPPEE